MIQFECYPQSKNNIYLKIITDHTEKGTLYRLASAIFILGLDIHSGEIKTKEYNGKMISEDVFILKTSEGFNTFSDFSSKLGILMESLLNRNQEPENILLNNSNRRFPSTEEIFQNGFEFVIEEYPDKNQFLFYFETNDRSGLLVSIAKFFYENQINIIEGKIQTDYENTAKDSFLLEYGDIDTFLQFKDQLYIYTS